MRALSRPVVATAIILWAGALHLHVVSVRNHELFAGDARAERASRAAPPLA